MAKTYSAILQGLAQYVTLLCPSSGLNEDTRGATVPTRREFTAATAAALIALATGGARAQTYPDRPIRILAGYPAGGGIDLVARLIGDPMKAALGQPVIVENRTGAAAMIAAHAVAKAAPDGHTLLMAASGEVAINHHVYRDRMTYDPLRELIPVALIGIVPCVVVVRSDAPVKTPAELVAYARANRGKLSFSSSGVGNPQHLAGELMNRMGGTDVLHVPYRGAAPAVTDVAVGAVTMSFTSLAAALPLMQDGKLRAVAVTSRERMPQLPEVAPLAEGAPGLAGYELLNWFALFAPAATPEPILARLHEVVSAALADTALAAKLDVQGIVTRPMNLAELRAFVRAEADKFGRIAVAANIKVE
jgi:tripartite-type tricarboxylate transporter receptor subunit TctC